MSIASFASAGGQGGQQLGLALAPVAVSAPSHAASLMQPAATFGNYGLAMRFVVKVHGFDGVETLGSWSSCKGLKVDFRTQAVADGNAARGLPTQVAYAPVVLERAVEKGSSQQLRKWLAGLITDWRSAAKKPTGTVEISLYDAQATQVASWVLTNAYPVSWSGPALDADQNKVAVETLTFEHEGFWGENDLPEPRTASRGGQGAALGEDSSKTTQDLRVASLAPADQGDAGVVFAYTPSTVVLSHTAPVVPSAALSRGRAADGADSRDALAGDVELPAVDVLERARATTRITLRALTLEGENVGRDGNRLLGWSRFAAVAEGAPSTKRAELPRLRFRWGPQSYLVRLTHVTVTYSRFDPNGKPLRAGVDLTLQTFPNPTQPTNPSSGGLPGRRTHLLTGAETLPELATRCYGGPGRWRDIATANGFQDPLRVRPGTSVYLPGAEENAR
ncbi:phage tail protein [Streptacidiphilus melanogenes]|uniref:phage tail protein n=1 Tax=Streptacidiphilus melanogenes TaxID=411235 RepID=UPI000694BB6E|nr:phage tail protein [Streptacidiphilus melanogenes]